jgi:acyl-CoA thioesterase
MPIRGVDPERVPARFRAMFTQNPFADHFDLEVVSAEDGRAILRFPLKREFTQYQGAVQGGVVVAYADAAMAIAIATVIEEGRDFVTTDLSVQFVRPFTAGAAIARGEVVHHGSRLIRGSAVVEIEGGGVAAYCTATFMIVDPRAAKPA